MPDLILLAADRRGGSETAEYQYTGQQLDSHALDHNRYQEPGESAILLQGSVHRRRPAARHEERVNIARHERHRRLAEQGRAGAGIHDIELNVGPCLDL